MYCDMCGALKRDFCICKKNLYKNIKVREVSYGLGYVMEGDVSTLTIDNVLTNLDYQFKELKGQLKETQEKLKIAVEALKNLIDKTEYGVNQWQKAWSTDKETEGQKAIKKARQALKKISELDNE